MATSDNSKIKILQPATESSKSDSNSLECDLCNRKFNKMAYYKSHYIRVHNKCIVVMPEKSTLKLKANPDTENKETVVETKNKTKTNVKTEKRKKSVVKTESKKEAVVKTESKKEAVIKTESKKEAVIKTESKEEAIIETKNKETEKIAETKNSKEIYFTFGSENEEETFNVKKKRKKEQYDCEVCGDTFNSFIDLEKHSLSHVQESKNKYDSTNVEKPIMCTECGERFALESAYNTHKLRHTLKCDRCDELFDSLELNFLKTHVCPGEVYDEICECEVCGKAYKNYTNLKVHRRVKHGLYGKT